MTVTRLTNQMRSQVKRRVLESVRTPREVALRAQEHALALRFLRARYGEDVFERCRALPEGWLQLHKKLTLGHDVTDPLPRFTRVERYVRSNRYYASRIVLPPSVLELAEYAPLPNSVAEIWTREHVTGRELDDLSDWFTKHVALEEELERLETEIRAALAAFPTVEKLAKGWPEGHAHLELAEPISGLPAPRIEDLNEHIAAAVRAAA